MKFRSVRGAYAAAFVVVAVACIMLGLVIGGFVYVITDGHVTLSVLVGTVCGAYLGTRFSIGCYVKDL